MGRIKPLITFIFFMTFHTEHVNYVNGAFFPLNFCWTAIFVSSSVAAETIPGREGVRPSSAVILNEDYSVCQDNDLACKALRQDNDRPGFDALKLIHRQIDDDHNGNVDLSESDEFLRDELKYKDDFDRHNVFHRGDQHVSVEELWTTWKFSTVYNWTVDETVRWLVDFVELPQYAETFQNNAIEGSTLPKLAVNSPTFLQGILGITNPIHRQKISLKAMDAVLFGPPKPMNSYIKDWVLVLSLIIALGGCWFAFVQHRYSRNHIMNELEGLQQAEDSLKQMQDKLDAAREEHECAVREKQYMEAQLKDEINKAKREAERLRQVRKSDIGSENTPEHNEEKLRLAEEELVQVRSALQETERQLDELMGWSPPSLLQQWLQLTHEVEMRHHTVKKSIAERQLHEAKEVCLKLRRKRGTLIGAFRMAHTNSMDEVETKMQKARSILTEVTTELKERAHRWGQIEMLCNFSVVSNPGFTVLAGALGLQNIIEQARSNDPSSIVGSVSHISESNPSMGIEECDDDLPPIPPSSIVGGSSMSTYTSAPTIRSNSTEYPTSRVRPMKTTQSLNNLVGGAVAPVRQQGKLSSNTPPASFYLNDSGSEGYSRQDSDVSTTMTSSTTATTPEEEPSTQREKKDQRSPPRGRLPSSVSDSSLVSALHRNGKDGKVSHDNLDDDDTGSIGSGSDVDEKKKRKKFFPLGRKVNRVAKAS
ncbi:stromal interaction molecule homolog isoform X2 [Apostichopus japonicus]|uniref:stromal interaction molecule homolog isoform X2 n=1 Tax=Stichopus japonicus TaxID=307972 RepID=UPI003AB83B94